MVEMKKKMIYFISTGNSARSQIAEGFAREYLDSKEWKVDSAGIEKRGLNPLTREVMREIGIDISNQQSTFIDTIIMEEADIVVSLSDDVRANFPGTSAKINNEHWAFEDPSVVEGTKLEKLDAFRRVRDQIESKIKDFAYVQKELRE